jgi:prephenate dehydrogenase
MSTDGFFEHVTIIGPGLIGGSLGLALKAQGLADRIVGVGHRQVSLDKALAIGAIDAGTLDATEGVRDADLVVLCTSVGRIQRQLRELVPCMKDGVLITDVGSIKGAICSAAAEALAGHGGPGMRFVGSHPLAGSEQRGIDAATDGLYDGATCILAPSANTDPDGSGLVALRAMWQAVGCVVKEFSPDLHDRLLAEVSHLPHVVAAALVNTVSEDALPLGATGFQDTTRIASGDPGLWVDICMANREGLQASLKQMQSELAEFQAAIESGNAETLARLFAEAKSVRDGRFGLEG